MICNLQLLLFDFVWHLRFKFLAVRWLPNVFVATVWCGDGMRLDWDAKRKDRKIDTWYHRSIIYWKSLELMRFFHVFLTEQFECASNCINANQYLQHVASRITTPSHSTLPDGMPAISTRELLLNTFEKLFPSPCLPQVCLTILFSLRTSIVVVCSSRERLLRLINIHLSNENVVLLDT